MKNVLMIFPFSFLCPKLGFVLIIQGNASSESWHNLAPLPYFPPPSFDNSKHEYENDGESVPVALVVKNVANESAAGACPLEECLD